MLMTTPMIATLTLLPVAAHAQWSGGGLAAHKGGTSHVLTPQPNQQGLPSSSSNGGETKVKAQVTGCEFCPGPYPVNHIPPICCPGSSSK
jgi:hypothetical protein